MRLTRRAILQSGAAALAAPAVAGLSAVSPAQAQAAAQPHAWKHGLSLFGELKYPGRLQAVRLRQRRARRRAASPA